MAGADDDRGTVALAGNHEALWHQDLDQEGEHGQADHSQPLVGSTSPALEHVAGFIRTGRCGKVERLHGQRGMDLRDPQTISTVAADEQTMRRPA